MTRQSKITVDDVQVVPPNDFSVAIVNGIINGVLGAFIGKLIAAGIDKSLLQRILTSFEAEHHLDFESSDPRFWESIVDGLKQYKEFGPLHPPQKKTEPVLLQGKSKRVSRFKHLESTLPPYQEGRDRQVHFEDDGTIVYAKEEGDWEPPRDIEGYERDTDDSWRFRPLWPECTRQYGIAVRTPACGCVNIIIRCNNRESLHFREMLQHTDCLNCQYRQELEEE